MAAHAPVPVLTPSAERRRALHDAAGSRRGSRSHHEFLRTLALVLMPLSAVCRSSPKEISESASTPSQSRRHGLELLVRRSLSCWEGGSNLTRVCLAGGCVFAAIRRPGNGSPGGHVSKHGVCAQRCSRGARLWHTKFAGAAKSPRGQSFNLEPARATAHRLVGADAPKRQEQTSGRIP